MTYTPKNLEKWQTQENYIGSDLSDQYVFISKNRDSCAMGRANFNAAIDALEVKGELLDGVEVEGFGHWACGWVETIMIDAGSVEALKIADDIKEGMDDYPLICDDFYYEEISEEKKSCLDDIGHYELTEISRVLGISYSNIDDVNEDALREFAGYIIEHTEMYYGEVYCDTSKESIEMTKAYMIDNGLEMPKFK